MADIDEWKPRTVIVGGAELQIHERGLAVMEGDDGQEAERCLWLLLAMSRAWEGCDRQTFLDEVPEKHAEEAPQYFDMSWEVEHGTV